MLRTWLRCCAKQRQIIKGVIGIVEMSIVDITKDELIFYKDVPLDMYYFYENRIREKGLHDERTTYEFVDTQIKFILDGQGGYEDIFPEIYVKSS